MNIAHYISWHVEGQDLVMCLMYRGLENNNPWIILEEGGREGGREDGLTENLTFDKFKRQNVSSLCIKQFIFLYFSLFNLSLNSCFFLPQKTKSYSFERSGCHDIAVEFWNLQYKNLKGTYRWWTFAHAMYVAWFMPEIYYTGSRMAEVGI